MIARQWEILDPLEDPAAVYLIEVVNCGKGWKMNKRSLPPPSPSDRIQGRAERGSPFPETKNRNKKVVEATALAYVLELEAEGCVIYEMAYKRGPRDE